MQSLIQDLHYGLRQLAKNPRFALTSVVSLALAIGATTAVFSVIYAALLNPYPYSTANRIVRLTVTSISSPSVPMRLTGAQVLQVQQVKPVESVLAMDYQAMTLAGPTYPENVNKIGIISTGFRDLGMRLTLGRGIQPSDVVEGHDPQPVAVLSYRFWQKHFFGDPAVLGRRLQLDRRSYVVVGVAAPRFTWYSADVYLPLKLTSDAEKRLMVDLLLKPGVSKTAVNAALQPVLERFAKEDPKQFPKAFRVEVEGLNAWVVRQIGSTLYLLLGAVGLLLAIGCVNVSILLLARGAYRQHELALRMALGARRNRIVRQLLTESVVLACTGGLFGIGMAYGILKGIHLLIPYAFAPEVVMRINVPVLGFTAGLAITTGVAFGLWPALKLSRSDIGHMAQSGSRRSIGSVSEHRLQEALIAGQIALTLLLLAGAGSAVEAFTRLLHIPLGYDPRNVMAAGIPLQDGAFPTWTARAAYFEQLRTQIARTPGVIMTSIASNATPPSSGWFMRFGIMGKTDSGTQMASLELVGPGYFSTLNVPLIEGRVWSDEENRQGALVAVINRTMARHYFPNGGAIGSSLRLPEIQNRPPAELSAPNLAHSWIVIVGIVGDSLDDGLSNVVRPAIYVPYTLHMSMGTQILIRTRVAPVNLVNAVREQVSRVNPDQQAYGAMADLDKWVSDDPAWQQDHLISWLFGCFALIALLLAASGLFSIVSYIVAQRTREFGIRMALGARRRHVLGIAFASTATSMTIGIVIV